MTAVFPTLIAVLLGLSFEEYYAESAMPEANPWQILLTIPLCLVPMGAAEFLFWLTKRRYEQGRPLNVRSFARFVAALPLPLYAVCVLVIGWPKVLVPLGVESTFLVDHLIVLLPYFLLLGCSLVEASRLKRNFRLSEKGPVPVSVRDVLGTVWESARQLGVVLVPIFGLILILDLARDTPLRIYFNHVPLLASLLLIATLFALAVIYPMLFRLGVGLKPLVEGAPLRKRLEQQAKELNFRYRDILYWPTKRPTLNAAIMGVVPRFRYVILTEELCKRLTLDELCAVFTHEVGHGKRRHAILYLIFSVAYLTAMIPVGEWVGTLVSNISGEGVDASLAAILFFYLPAFAFYWIVLFGLLSRRFELEADVYGVESTKDPSLFIMTLEKVARLGKVERRRRTSRHFSIAGRTDFLRRAFVDREPGLKEGFASRLRVTRRAIVWGAGVIFLLAGSWLTLESIRGAGIIFLERDRDLKAQMVLEWVVDVDSEDDVALALLSEIHLYLSTPPTADADPYWKSVLTREPTLKQGERVAVLDQLRAGWGRSIARGRDHVAQILLERACLFNRVGGADSGAVIDADFESSLAGMRLVSESLEQGDLGRLKPILERPPRWLRRPDLHPALEFLKHLKPNHNAL